MYDFAPLILFTLYSFFNSVFTSISSANRFRSPVLSQAR
jgi:hypothetical protein